VKCKKNDHDLLYDNALGHWWCRDCDHTEISPWKIDYKPLIKEMVMMLRAMHFLHDPHNENLVDLIKRAEKVLQ